MTNEGAYQLSIALRAYLAHSNKLTNSIYFRYQEFADGSDDETGNFLEKIRALGTEEEQQLIKFLSVAHEQTGALLETLDKIRKQEE